jgi:hypothetical protein
VSVVCDVENRKRKIGSLGLDLLGDSTDGVEGSDDGDEEDHCESAKMKRRKREKRTAERKKRKDELLLRDKGAMRGIVMRRKECGGRDKPSTREIDRLSQNEVT